MLINKSTQEQIEKIAKACKETKPLVAIRCITYNHEPYIRDALEGFVMQKTNFPFVAIVHDDASTDGTAAIIREYAEKYPDIIKPIYETENQYSKGDGSLSRVMNEACEATGAKYYALCEGDDYWTAPLKLQKQVDALENNPDCTIALNRVLMVNKERKSLNRTIPLKKKFKEGIITLKDLMTEEFYNGNWTFHTSCYLYRSLLQKNHIENLKSILKKFPYGDMPLLLTCLIGGNGYFFPTIMGCYTVLSGGFNSRMSSNSDYASMVSSKVSVALEDINKYTNFEYKKELNRAITKYKLHSEIINSDTFNYEWISLKYWPYRKLLFYNFLRIKFPKILKVLKWMKTRIRS